MLGVDAFVTRAEIGAREKAEQFVRSGAADDARGIEAVASRDRLPQRRRLSVQNPFANPVSTPAADQPSTITGYTHRTLMRSTR